MWMLRACCRLSPLRSTAWSIAVGADGALWCAAGADGLWTFRDGQGWERVQSEHTTRVKRALDKLWIARSVTRAGAPVGPQ